MVSKYGPIRACIYFGFRLDVTEDCKQAWFGLAMPLLCGVPARWWEISSGLQGQTGRGCQFLGKLE